jgi:hypothetical protein
MAHGAAVQLIYSRYFVRSGTEDAKGCQRDYANVELRSSPRVHREPRIKSSVGIQAETAHFKIVRARTPPAA